MRLKSREFGKGARTKRGRRMRFQRWALSHDPRLPVVAVMLAEVGGRFVAERAVNDPRFTETLAAIFGSP